jgi:hypothetical protein
MTDASAVELRRPDWSSTTCREDRHHDRAAHRGAYLGESLLARSRSVSATARCCAASSGELARAERRTDKFPGRGGEARFVSYRSSGCRAGSHLGLYAINALATVSVRERRCLAVRGYLLRKCARPVYGFLANSVSPAPVEDASTGRAETSAVQSCARALQPSQAG